MYPEQLKYTKEHEWVSPPNADGVVRVGITNYAQEALGDIVYVALPETGRELTEGQPLGEVESTKSVSDVYAPVSGTVVARNERLDQQPELINADPYGDGWICEIQLVQRDAVDALMDAAAYEHLLGSA